MVFVVRVGHGCNIKKPNRNSKRLVSGTGTVPELAAEDGRDTHEGKSISTPGRPRYRD